MLNMRFFFYLWGDTVILILLCLLMTCGFTENERWPIRIYIQGIPIISDVSPDEIAAITLVEQAIQEYALTHPINTTSTKGIFFVRDPNQPMPEYCKGNSCDHCCADKWKDYPRINKTPERYPGLGYAGMTGVHIYISRIGPHLNESSLLDLLVHERVHEITGLGDTSTHQQITQEIKEIVYRIKGAE